MEEVKENYKVGFKSEEYRKMRTSKFFKVRVLSGY
jgi:hypothetical protein